MCCHSNTLIPLKIESVLDLINILIGKLLIQATLLNPDMCNPDFRLNRTDGKVPVLFYTYNSYMHNPDFA